MSAGFNDFLDGPCTMDRFVGTALGRIERAEIAVRLPSNKSVWPADVWAEMQSIQRGERDCDFCPTVKAGLQVCGRCAEVGR